jgi:hypothetical protein
MDWLWDDRGNYSAATNVFPSAGGSAGGAILKGDIWTISAVGTLGGVVSLEILSEHSLMHLFKL